MDEVAKMSTKDRGDIFSEAAVKMRTGMLPALIEKDFWVCWMLRRVFSLPSIKGGVLFKGGTSLSKCFNAIKRFSEDIDLSVDWRLIGFTDEIIWKSQSKTQTRKMRDEIDAAGNKIVSDKIKPELADRIRGCLGEGGWSIGTDDAGNNQQTLLFQYPRSTDNFGGPAQSIKLEFGCYAMFDFPIEVQVKPYAAQYLPKLFKEPDTKVCAVMPEATFWEKAAILHEWHHSGKFSPNGSRHYYDLYSMAQSSTLDAALKATEIRRKIMKHRTHLFCENQGSRHIPPVSK